MLRLHVTCLCSLLLLANVGVAQPVADPNAVTDPNAVVAEPTPANGRQPLVAIAIEVNGDVSFAPLDPNGAVGEFAPLEVDQELSELTVVRTGVLSSAKFQFGREEPYSAAVLDSASELTLSEINKDNTSKRVRLGLSYGQVRAGVAEGGLQSDFTIDSPIASLSKEGTWDFYMSYEQYTQRFEIGLLEFGLVKALNRATGQSRRVLPQQYVTNTLRLWLDQADRRSAVAINDMLGQSDIEIAYNRLQNDGLGVIEPGSGRVTQLQLNNPTAQGLFADTIRNSIGGPLPIGGGPVIPPNVITPPAIRRPEGFFGTGRGDDLVNVLISADSELAGRGFAQPGRYLFRRSALQNWMHKHGR